MHGESSALILCAEMDRESKLLVVVQLVDAVGEQAKLGKLGEIRRTLGNWDAHCCVGRTCECRHTTIQGSKASQKTPMPSLYI